MATKVIPFKSAGEKKDSEDGACVDHGTLGDLKYEVYKRGVIHIFDDTTIFKKDCGIFEDEVSKIDFTAMGDGDQHVIKGSGDNDDLVFMCDNDEIKISLTKKGLTVIEKLKSVLRKNRK